MGSLILVGMVVVVAISWITGIYNGLLKSINSCDESWADLQTELKRRYDLIPRLVEIVVAYAGYENEVLQRVAESLSLAQSNSGSPVEQSLDENLLAGSLRHLLVLSNAYPDLKANQSYLELQRELINTEDRIQRARRFYNANVRELNNRVDLFPSSLFATGMGILRREYFEIDQAAVQQIPELNWGDEE